MDFLKKVWQFVSFLFVLYGFYLLFLFLWDTLIRVNEKGAFLISLTITLTAMAVSGAFWARKNLRKLWV